MNQPAKYYTVKEIADSVGKSKQAVAKLLKKLDYEPVKRPPTTANQLPPTSGDDRQPVTGNHQPTTANQTANRLPKRGTLYYSEEARNAVIMHYNDVLEEQSTTANHRQPVTGNHQPTTANQPPTTANQLPVTNDDDRQPVTSAKEQENPGAGLAIATPGTPKAEGIEAMGGPKAKPEAVEKPENEQEPIGQPEALQEIVRAKDETIQALKEQLELSKSELSEKNETIAKLLQNLATEQATVQRLQLTLNNTQVVRGLEEINKSGGLDQKPGYEDESMGARAKEPGPQKERTAKKGLLARLLDYVK